MKTDNLIAAIQSILGAVDEANTIATYSRQVLTVAEQNPDALSDTLANYNEILGDELNHLIRFAFKYSELADVEISTDGLEEIGLVETESDE